MKSNRPAASRSDAPIRNTDDLLQILDKLLESRGDAWWDRLFADRTRSCPFTACVRFRPLLQDR
jgi:hypothetical protein